VRIPVCSTPRGTWRVSAAVGRAHLLGDLDHIVAGELAGPIPTSGARRGLSLRQLQERLQEQDPLPELAPGQPGAGRALQALAVCS
jgi:hypothetical protein